MQKITGKELTVRKAELGDLLKGALEHHGHCEAARGSVLNAQQVALWHGWQAGVRLNKLRALVPSGDWLDWLELNFCRPNDIAIRTAQVYMKIDGDNAELRDVLKTQRVAHGEPDLQLLTRLKFDTVRKYAIGFVPEKSQPVHSGNQKFSRLATFLNIANEFARVKQRDIDGLQKIDWDEAREETRELYLTLKWLHGDASTRPW